MSCSSQFTGDESLNAANCQALPPGNQAVEPELPVAAAHVVFIDRKATCRWARWLRECWLHAWSEVALRTRLGHVSQVCEDNPQIAESPMHGGSLRSGVLASRVGTSPALIRPADGPMRPDGAPALEAVDGNDVDRTLLAAVAARNEAAFNEIYARYHRRIARFARRITRCSELAAEITNDTLWAIWRCAPSFKGRSTVSTWIMGIAYHIGRNRLKSNRRREAHEEPMRHLIEAAHEPWSDGDLREWVGAALVQLSEEQRSALELFYRFGHSCEEIAQMVDCPANTVKTRMYHGRRRMREALPRLAGFESASKSNRQWNRRRHRPFEPRGS